MSKLDDAAPSPRVPGFRFASIASGIKPNGALDLALAVADRPVAAAAVLTQNMVRAAPVDLVEARVKGGEIGAILVNSGNANAVTGAEGMKAALDTTARVAEALGLKAAQVLPASTGVIGVLLPADRIVEATPRLVAGLSADGLGGFAEAIRTTDRYKKIAQRSFAWGGRTYEVVAVAKGAGMIHPNMATTLGFVFTDAPVELHFLREALRASIEDSFNRITVDGDTSTNDTVVAMASGASGGDQLTGDCEGSALLRAAMLQVLEDVAKAIVADGEGAERIARIEVRGAKSDAEATQIARTIATSPLVKTALHGKDPNWGRILAAAGRAGVRFDPDKADLDIGGQRVLQQGKPVMDAAREAAASAAMAEPEVEIEFTLSEGSGRGWYWACDLGHAYVSLNADYRS